MAKKPTPAVEQETREALATVGHPAKHEDLEVLGRYKERIGRSRNIAKVLGEWKNQQVQDRALRDRYARYLIWLMAFQILCINVIYLLMGCRVLVYDPWASSSFTMGVFVELTALVLVVVKYLFQSSSDKILDLVHSRTKQMGTPKQSRGKQHERRIQE
jgi:hypothetical protein